MPVQNGIVSLLSKIKNTKRLVCDKDFRSSYLSDRGIWLPISDEELLRRKYRFKMGKELNLDNPRTYTEKLQWLKLHDRRPIYTTMVDKVGAKVFAAEKIGAQYVIPTIGTWDRPEDIDFDALPDQFVLKCSHDSGGIVICKDKSKLDRAAARKKLARCLKRDYYRVHREWPYKNVERKILAEAYLEDGKTQELRDYKFFTFGGVPKVLYIAQGRGRNAPTVADFFDMDFRHLPFVIDHDMSQIQPEKPTNFCLMQELASKLAEGTPELRVDFYEVNGKVYFGEMTFFHCSGFHGFTPEVWDETFGEWVTLP